MKFSFRGESVILAEKLTTRPHSVFYNLFHPKATALRPFKTILLPELLPDSLSLRIAARGAASLGETGGRLLTRRAVC
jgi:hypothetical protein